MALAEGMACGLACVAFDCAPGVREIVTDGVDGIVVPPRNVEALADGLSRLMGDEEPAPGLRAGRPRERPPVRPGRRGRPVGGRVRDLVDR